jgi:hypothetical protein
MNILPPGDSAVCPCCRARVMNGDRFCRACGRALPYAGMEESLLRPEREALHALQENMSTALEYPPEPLHSFGFSLQNLKLPFFSTKMNFYYVPETGHFYAVYERGDPHRPGEPIRSWDALEKVDLLRIMHTLGEHEEYFHICSLPEDGSPAWKPMRHGSPEADDEPALPAIPAPPRTEEEAQAREAAALKAFRDIDWERGGYRLPVPGAVYLWNRYYYVPTTRRFYKVEQSGNYYHGYESEISGSSKGRLLSDMLHSLKTDALLGSDIREALGRIMELCAVYWLVSRMPDDF